MTVLGLVRPLERIPGDTPRVVAALPMANRPISLSACGPSQVRGTGRPTNIGITEARRAHRWEAPSPLEPVGGGRSNQIWKNLKNAIRHA
jgi:hypothetical protein